ncbi:MAG: carboxylate-amine ligase [Rhodospirillaceae bacterium]|nr:carboxylate-amine ligase [Rhodospirillaceae bacterium]
MPSSTEKFTVGIEEEYLLIDPETRDLISEPSDAVLQDCEAAIDASVGGVRPEFLRAQVEVGTEVCTSIAEARHHLTTLRRTVAEVAENHGMKIIAASTHPFANWSSQRHTDKDRYNVLAQDMQTLAHRLLICGMHVHVGVEDPEDRIDLLNQIPYFLPHILALTTSSSFWQGQNTGLKSYRVSVFDEMPRTGLPEKFDSYGEYERHVKMLVDAELIEDSSKIWWDVRPHGIFPTLEMRIADICTRLEDGLTIAALYACLLSMLSRLRRDNQRWRVYSNMLVHENRWLAQRYGIDGGLVDFGKGERVPYADLLEEIITLVREDAQRLDCVAEVERARQIIADGTSAHHQVAIYEKATGEGADAREALAAVVDWLAEESLRGIAGD